MLKQVVLITTFLLNFLFIAPILKPAPESEFFRDASARESVVLEDFAGRVMSVVDGDTIEVLHNGNPERVRLNGIDCPERTQAFGTEATRFTEELVKGKTVTVNMLAFDKYGRTIGESMLADSRNLSQELVKAGLA